MSFAGTSFVLNSQVSFVEYFVCWLLEKPNCGFINSTSKSLKGNRMVLIFYDSRCGDEKWNSLEMWFDGVNALMFLLCYCKGSFNKLKTIHKETSKAF